MTKYYPILLTIILACFSLSCSLTANSAESAILPTRTRLPTFTPTPAEEVIIVPPTPTKIPPSPTPAHTATPLPTPIPSATPLPPTPAATPTPAVLMATVQENMNVRSGPGTNYMVVGSATAGNSSKILGRNKEATWVQVEYPSKDGKAWVFTQLITTTGDVNSAPVVEVAPPVVVANPKPNPKPTEKPKDKKEPPAAPKFQFVPDAWHASANAGIVQFKGRIKDKGGNSVNGFSVLADNGSFKVLSHPTGASRWYPDMGDGNWDIVMPNIRDAQGMWTLTVVLYGCDFSGGFNAQCKTYTKLSEDVKVEIATPKESIINANWLCNWDCNKGLYTEGYKKPK